MINHALITGPWLCSRLHTFVYETTAEDSEEQRLVQLISNLTTSSSFSDSSFSYSNTSPLHHHLSYPISPILPLRTPLPLLIPSSFLPPFTPPGIQVVTNAGGINPEGCMQALKKLASAQGVELSVAMVTGDDMMNKVNPDLG